MKAISQDGDLLEELRFGLSFDSKSVANVFQHLTLRESIIEDKKSGVDQELLLPFENLKEKDPR